MLPNKPFNNAVSPEVGKSFIQHFEISVNVIIMSKAKKAEEEKKKKVYYEKKEKKAKEVKKK
jgi:hypothetical protein